MRKNNEKKLHFSTFNGKVNIKLFNEIIEFIVGGNSEPTLIHLKSAHLWYKETFDDNIRNNYGFRYFGELLERYEERFGSDISDIRAIMLAMAFSKDILTDDMFVGRQKEDFLRKITSLAEKDLYLKGALYIFGKGEKDVRGLLYDLTTTNYASAEDLIFVMSLLDDFEEAFTIFKPQLIKLLGTRSAIRIDENTGIFCWLIKKLRQGSWLKNIRTKDIALFRAFAELPVSFIKEGNKHHKVLLANGYSAEDILYLNSVAIRNRVTNDTIDVYSIVAHKIAIHMCEVFLNSERTHSKYVYEHLKWLLEKYEKFAIKVSGNEGIYDAIKNTIRLSNPQTYLWLYRMARPKGIQGYGREMKLPDEIFYFDILDERWVMLSSQLSSEDYRYFFDKYLLYKCFNMSKEQIMKYILKYDALTGLSYLEAFSDEKFYKHSSAGDSIFALMAEKDVINLVDVFESSEDIAILLSGNADKSSLKNINISILQYIMDYTKGLQNRKAFDFYQYLCKNHSIDKIGLLVETKSYGGQDHYFIEPFYKGPVKYQSDYGKPRFTVNRPFLTDDEHKELFGWLDNYMFKYKTKQYAEFTALMLLDNFMPTLFSKEELRTIFDMVKDLGIDIVTNNHNLRELKERYLTETELQVEKEANIALGLERERIARENELQKLKDEYASYYKGTFRSISMFIDRHKGWHSKEADALTLTAEYFLRTLNDMDYILDAENLEYFLKVGSVLFGKGVISFVDFKGHISKVKEAQNNESGFEESEKSDE